jgi:hypothetical protein
LTYFNLTEIDIVFCDKKYAVISYQVLGNPRRIMTVDLKNNQTTTSSASGVDCYNNTNGEYGGPGDKSGFFAIEFVVATGEYTFERRSYKPETF